MLYVVGFSRKDHFFARAIMWFTRSKYSHAYIRQVGPASDYVLEANWRGVNLQWRTIFLREGAHGIREFEVLGDAESLDDAWRRTIIRRLNRPYSYWQIIGDAVVIALGRIGVQVRNPLGQKRADVCSELVLAWLRSAGVGGLDGLVLDTVSPEDLVGRIEAKPSSFREVRDGV